MANLQQLAFVKQGSEAIFTAKPRCMKACFAIMGSFLQLSLLAQVPEKGLVSDPDGNIFIAIHAPISLTYDGIMLPLSSKTSTYVLKTDSNGDLIALCKADGSATIAGPLSFQNDTLYFAQAAFNCYGENEGEIVLTKLNSNLDYRSTVTFPLPVNARPLAVYYFNNHWGFVYASKSGDKLIYTLAGISHVYTNKWMKSITPYHVSGILGENNDMTVSGTFFNVLRYDGQQINSGGLMCFC